MGIAPLEGNAKTYLLLVGSAVYFSALILDGDLGGVIYGFINSLGIFILFDEFTINEIQALTWILLISINYLLIKRFFF